MIKKIIFNEEKIVKESGNGCVIYIPRKYINMKARIVIRENDE